MYRKADYFFGDISRFLFLSLLGFCDTNYVQPDNRTVVILLLLMMEVLGVCASLKPYAWNILD